MNSALSHSTRYPNARRTTLERLAKQDATSAALRADVAKAKRQKRIDAVRRVLWRLSIGWRW
jgi:hypothetical protein